MSPRTGTVTTAPVGDRPDPMTLPAAQRARRDRIIAAAMTLLAGAEYESVQMRDIADAAGVASSATVAMCEAMLSGVTTLVDLSVAAEECGVHGVSLPEHLVTPTRIETPNPYVPTGGAGYAPDTPFIDPFIAFGAISSRTRSRAVVLSSPGGNVPSRRATGSHSRLMLGQRPLKGGHIANISFPFFLERQPLNTAFFALGAVVHQFLANLIL